MNKYLLILLLVGFASMVFSQTPDNVSYQGIVRDGAGTLITDKQVSLKLSILDGSTVVYAETFSAHVNASGVFSVNIGSGTAVTGTFSEIEWSTGGIKALKTEIDPAGGSAYVALGITPFTNVPYALVADKVANMSLNDLMDVSSTDPDLNDVLQWNGTAWTPANVATMVTTTSALSGNGTTAEPLNIASQGATSGQILQWNGSSWSPATVSGGVGDNWGTQFVQKNVTLDGNGTGASPLKIAQQGAVTGESMIWNGSVWGPGKPAISIDNVFSGTGTPATPLKLSQQGATAGQVLKWSGVTWVPGDPVSIPFLASGTGMAGSASFTILNPSDGIAIEGFSNSGTGLRGSSDAVNGKGVAGYSSNGYAVYGSSSNGLAGLFDGTVAVTGKFKVQGSQVLRFKDVYVADQPNSIFNAPSNTLSSIPGLDAVAFTVDDGVSAATPAKVLVTVSCPNYTATAANASVRYSVIIKSGSTTVGAYDFYTTLTQNATSSFNFSRHFKINDAGDYTAVLQILPSGSAVSSSYHQMQVQVLHP